LPLPHLLFFFLSPLSTFLSFISFFCFLSLTRFLFILISSRRMYVRMHACLLCVCVRVCTWILQVRNASGCTGRIDSRYKLRKRKKERAREREREERKRERRGGRERGEGVCVCACGG
jgi:hypothetical protein